MRMATRMNMLKLLQEIRGIDDLANRRPFSRYPGLFSIPLRFPTRKAPPKVKRTIPISMQDETDIPAAVPIRFVT